MSYRTKKIPVGILGATGSVGQKFIQLLENHPYFEISELAASERSVGKLYAEAVNWILSEPIPEKVARLAVKNAEPGLDCKLVFSGLDSSVAGEIEETFARAGYIVISNAKNHRYDPWVPLLIPEVNPDHLNLLLYQEYGGGKIITNPNCSTIGLVIALKPLLDNFGLEKVNVTTMQAISGAGFPGIASLSIADNIIPFIDGEEEKIELEPLKILGTLTEKGIGYLDIPISSQCNRVPVIDGHTEAVQVKLKTSATPKDIVDVWRNFRAKPQELQLPFAPENPIIYFDEPFYPQPRLHRNAGNGMAVSIGRLRSCKIFDYKFVVLSHNTVRGAAGGAILCAELVKELFLL